MESKTLKRWRFLACTGFIVILFLLAGNMLRPDALAQLNSVGTDSGSLIVVPVDLGRDSHGIVMVDTNLERLWVYEFTRGMIGNRLRLIAARNWEYDRLLDEYNNGEPTPGQVKDILERLNKLPKKEMDTLEKSEEVAEDSENAEP